MIDGEHSDLIGDKHRWWAGLIWSNTDSADHRVQICAVRIGQICGVKILPNANSSASRVQICAVDARNVCRLSMPPLKHSQIIHYYDNHDDDDDGKSGQSGGNDRRGSFLTQGVGPRGRVVSAKNTRAYICNTTYMYTTTGAPMAVGITLIQISKNFTTTFGTL